MLRENLKQMSDNVNVLIDKMNQESLKKRRVIKNGRKGDAADDVKDSQSVAGSVTGAQKL